MATTRLVKIDWLDAVASTGWGSDPVEPTVNVSVGFIVYETEDYIQVAGTLDAHSSNYNNSMTIPSGMILEVKDLHETKQRKSKRPQSTEPCSESTPPEFQGINPFGCTFHFNGSDRDGRSDVIDGNRTLSYADRMQEQSIDSNLQGLRASNFSREPGAIASD